MFIKESTFFGFNGTFIGALRAIDMLLWEDFVLSTIKWFLSCIYSFYVLNHSDYKGDTLR